MFSNCATVNFLSLQCINMCEVWQDGVCGWYGPGIGVGMWGMGWDGMGGWVLVGRVKVMDDFVAAYIQLTFWGLYA